MQYKLVKTIYRKELRDILRDRRTLFVMIVLPLLLYPLLMIGFLQLLTLQMGRIEQKPLRLVLIGRDAAGRLGDSLANLPGIRLLSDTTTWQTRITTSDLDAAVVFPPGFSDSLATGKMPAIRVFYNSSEKVSERARGRINSVLDHFQERVVEQRLLALRADTTLLHPFAVEDENLATNQQKQGDFIGSILPYLLISMMLMGAFYPALDLTAGEKERGTMETLLVSPASRADIVYGKFLTVMTITLMTAMLNLLSLSASLYLMLQMIGQMAVSSGQALSDVLPQIAISPVSFAMSLALVIPLAVMFGALCLAVAVGARNYKEGQSLLTPIFAFVILPAMVSLLPGTEVTPILAVVPVANISLLIKEFMSGHYMWLETTIALASTSALAGAALWWATNQFRQEAVLFRHAEEIRWSPLSLFRRRPKDADAPIAPFPSAGTALLLVVIEVLLLTIISARAAQWGLAQVLMISQAALVIPAFYLVRHGRFDWKRVFAVKLPSVSAWPAALLTITGGWLFAIGLSIAQNHILPFPTELIDRFSQFFGELNDWPAWAVVAMIGLLPGICEELVCRGFLLHSFVPRFGTTGGVIITALAFGLLHLDPYRFVGTAFLGLLLGYIVVKTDSIFPAMLAHATNNILSYLVQRHADMMRSIHWLDVESTQWLPWYMVAASVAAMLVGILWLKRAGHREAAPPAADASLTPIHIGGE
jgi:sodium transport system permease protein